MAVPQAPSGAFAPQAAARRLIVISQTAPDAYFRRMKQMHSLLCAFGLVTTVATGLSAETVDQVLDADLIPGWVMPSGRHMAGLNLELAPGWKTYWRSPGDAGIPPSFDWSGSENVKSVRVHWPSPVVFHLNDMQSIGYHDQVVLPLEVVAKDPAAPVRLRLRLDLGVCKDICVPASVDLTTALGSASTADRVISAAMQNAPVTAAKAGLRAIACQIDPVADGLRLTATLALPSVGDDETVVFESGMKGVWVAPSVTTRTAGTLVAITEMVPPSGQPFALDRSAVTLTVLAGGRAVEVKGCPAP